MVLSGSTARAVLLLLLLLVTAAVCSSRGRHSRNSKKSYAQSVKHSAKASVGAVPSKIDSNSDVLVVAVERPGTSIIPSNGRLLTIKELNSKRLIGAFTNSNNVRIEFESRCSGYLQLKHGGKTFLQVENVTSSGTKELLYGKLKGKAFVYDHQLGHIYELSNRQRQPTGGKALKGEGRHTKRSVEEHWHRSKRSNAKTAEEDLAQAEKSLSHDQYFRQLPNLVIALGEFGIAASSTPCAKPLIMAGYDVHQQLHTGMNSTAMGNTMAKAGERRRGLYNKRVEAMEEEKAAKSRQKRWLGGRRRRRRTWLGNAFRVVKYFALARFGITGVRLVGTTIYNAIFQECERHNPGKVCHYKTPGGWPECPNNQCLDSKCTSASNEYCVCRQCPGLCGNGCACDWNEIICGNCCKHRGCFEHDICCKARGGLKSKTNLICLSAYLTLGGSFSCGGGFDPYPSCTF